METVDCVVCGTDNSASLFKGRDRLLGGTKIFDLVRCRGCGLIYINPRPTLDEITRYYPAEYEPFARQEQITNWYDRLRYRIAIARMCRIAGQGQQPGRLLDVGCGDGDFMLGMRERGWRVCGLDISPVAVSLAREKGLDVFQGQLPDADLGDESFDLVTMWDVLEHLHDPATYLARVARLLKPKGKFVVTLPNPASLDFRLFGPIWTGLDVPRHLYAFEPSALGILFQQSGLETEAARCVYGGQRVSTWSLEWLIDERLPGARANGALKRLIYSPIWYWAWRPIYFIIDLLGLGSSITYTCRRTAQGSP